MKNKIIPIGIMVVLSVKLTAQDTISDSCLYHSEIFKDTLNFCDGSLEKSYKFIEKNCFKIGVTTEEEVVALLGCNIWKKDTMFVHRVTPKMVHYQIANWIDYDYYISYFFSLYCFGDRISYLPSTKTMLFFKNKILIAIEYKTYG